MAIDLNADLGESFGRWQLGDDRAMLGVVTSANIACGFHAGDPATLVRTCRDAVAAGVAIGAQVGYRDLAGFGRRFIDVDPSDLYADVLYQLGALDGIARSVGGRVGYVKPHGALYNAVHDHDAQAAAVVAAVVDYGRLKVLGAPGSALLAKAADAGLAAVAEGFADRRYNADGTLLSRREPGAVLDDPDEVAAQAIALATGGVVYAAEGSTITVSCESICVHGDSPGAVELASRVRTGLASAGIELAPFASVG